MPYTLIEIESQLARRPAPRAAPRITPGPDMIAFRQSSVAQLLPGQTARIRAVEGEESTRHRLLEMGLTAGTPVRVVCTAPLGDPLQIDIRGYRLGLRRTEAATLLIEEGG